MVVFDQIVKTYDNVTAVNDLSLEVKQGELLVLIGPSGCGKTTSLKMINRIISPTSGRIIINGTDTSEMDPINLRREIGYVIQEGGLFPHKTVANNIAVVPKLKKWDKASIAKRVDELLELVNMDPDLYRDRFPRELSGGQQQRIGVLRALASEPDVMLMDEPFGALDPITREQLQDELKRLQEKVHKTIVFVTHDMDEALGIGDRIALMKDGEAVQIDTPDRLMKHPKNDFVINFIGRKRLLKGAEKYTIAEIISPSFDSVSMNEPLSTLSKRDLTSVADTLICTDEQGLYQGVISVKSVQQATDPNQKRFESLITNHPSLPGHTDIKSAVRFLLDHNLSFVPVVSENQQVSGVLTQSNLNRFILDHL